MGNTTTEYCASCSVLYEPTEMHDLAGYYVCDKCRKELRESVIGMVHKYQSEHKIQGPKCNHESIAMDLLFEVIATDF